ncbi:MAG: molecular chaperone HtpG [Ruminococcaceae bacterium]|nr:molecular chaperone HtpG [Oscillospiraceae bacterium]
MSENNTAKRGGISVEMEHIFPVIKKWLYSEKEIFLREIVSNACDACTKLGRLVSLGETSNVDTSKFRIDVILDKSAKTITVSDNGIGMTEEELQKYLCQIALSGALDFIDKYEGESEGAGAGIIGHFGLGFYSSFMVSDTVEVITRSHDLSPAVKWVCGTDGDYEITAADPDDDDTPARGTTVIMHISGEGEEYLNEYKLREIIDKYCAFMPVEIYFIDADKEDSDEEEKSVNDTEPLWLKPSSECGDEEYADFYRKVFHDFKEPLFHIHLRADYPLNFKGILYFPRITNEYESLEGQVKLYYNQVFVADNIKEVIPEYLLMLKGVLDCPELPLNVSRSYLQNSGYVSKISAHITKKVADKLVSMFNTDREGYEKIWRDVKTFVEYASLRDQKFYDRVKSAILLEKCSGGFVTLDEYLETAKEKHEGKIYYANDKTAQASYISMFSDEGIETVLFDRLIDTNFITFVEHNNDALKFVRVDAEVAGSVNDEDSSEPEGVADLFGEIVAEGTKISFEKLRSESIPAVLNVSEESRRMEDMMRMYSGGADMPKMPVDATLVINTSSSLIANLAGKIKTDPDTAKVLAKHIYSLCLLSQRKLTADELTEFLSDSYNVLGKL